MSISSINPSDSKRRRISTDFVLDIRGFDDKERYLLNEGRQNVVGRDPYHNIYLNNPYVLKSGHFDLRINDGKIIIYPWQKVWVQIGTGWIVATRPFQIVPNSTISIFEREKNNVPKEWDFRIRIKMAEPMSRRLVSELANSSILSPFDSVSNWLNNNRNENTRKSRATSSINNSTRSENSENFVWVEPRNRSHPKLELRSEICRQKDILRSDKSTAAHRSQTTVPSNRTNVNRGVLNDLPGIPVTSTLQRPPLREVPLIERTSTSIAAALESANNLKRLATNVPAHCPKIKIARRITGAGTTYSIVQPTSPIHVPHESASDSSPHEFLRSSSAEIELPVTNERNTLLLGNPMQQKVHQSTTAPEQNDEYSDLAFRSEHVSIHSDFGDDDGEIIVPEDSGVAKATAAIEEGVRTSFTLPNMKLYRKKVFRNVSETSGHLNLALVPSICSCEPCGTPFKNINNFNAHSRQTHKNSPKPGDIVKAQVVYGHSNEVEYYNKCCFPYCWTFCDPSHHKHFSANHPCNGEGQLADLQNMPRCLAGDLFTAMKSSSEFGVKAQFFMLNKCEIIFNGMFHQDAFMHFAQFMSLLSTGLEVYNDRERYTGTQIYMVLHTTRHEFSLQLTEEDVETHWTELLDSNTDAHLYFRPYQCRFTTLVAGPKEILDPLKNCILAYCEQYLFMKHIPFDIIAFE